MKKAQKDPTQLGMNRTGMDMSPIDSQKLIANTERTVPSSLGTEEALLKERARYITEASPVGSVPIPGTAKGMGSATLKKLSGKNPEVLIDKLGERLGFERTGTRLYDALIGKAMAWNEKGSGLVSLETLRDFRDEEARHMGWVRDAIRELGADPTAMTPCADTGGVMAMGLSQVLGDPRASLSQSLEAILVAELADNDGWKLLIDLTRQMGLEEIAAKFEVAKAQEDVHLAQVRGWLREMTLAKGLMKAA